MIAIIEAYKSGLFRSQNWLPNIIAGITVGIIALPLAMAFAIASGAKPEQGIYTAIISGIIVGLFGGSRVQIAGPTGAFIVILSMVTAKYGIEGLQIATLMAGFILAFMGIAKLGNIIKFIPDPVIMGFTSGISVIIFVSEWQNFFGLPKLPQHLIHFHEKLLFLLKVNLLLHANLLLIQLNCLMLLRIKEKTFCPLVLKIGKHYLTSFCEDFRIAKLVHYFKSMLI